MKLSPNERKRPTVKVLLSKLNEKFVNHQTLERSIMGEITLNLKVKRITATNFGRIKEKMLIARESGGMNDYNPDGDDTE